MYNYSTQFFSEKRAKAFAENLEKQGHKADIWSERDRLNNGTIYFVKWN